jgi:DNA-damage-inducible protein D
MNTPHQNFSQNLESIKKMIGDFEYWSARELYPLLGYKEWRKFSDAISRAKNSCTTQNINSTDHFVGADKMVAIGSKTKRTVDDILLTRYACYLIAQNGDPRKPEIAEAQMYFATQTRRQEIREISEYEQKRIASRKKLSETEKTIRGTVYARGINTSIEFATFKDKHIQALYGGINTKQLKIKKKIPNNRPLADFDSDVELRAKDFALAMTDHNIKTKHITGKDRIHREVVENSQTTRTALLSRGIIPENLPAEPDIKKIIKKQIGKKITKKRLQ